MSMYTKYKTYEEVVTFLKEDADSPQCFTVNYLPDTDEYELWIGNQPYYMYDRWIEEEQDKVRDLKKEVNKLKVKLYDCIEKNKQSFE